MHIKAEKCPDCGAEIKSKREFDKHSNGHWNERVEFKCGASLGFSPNYMKVMVHDACGNSATQVAERRARRKLADDVRELVGASTCSNAYKELLLRAVPLP